ncbi:NAD(P)-binding protein [Stenotrophomonas indicatrix]|uniref:NAD(P)-binding protein n=1 Tax=Stenotrophomonas indicatrix TaxID=2045451 RepID=UPI001CC04ACB|nr:NAD(P)-binding protein [Stenotrophomonas indicatrix]
MNNVLSVFDCFGLLASKVAPNVFDLSSGQYHVSLRDQIVRGRLLVRDLCAVNSSFDSLLVVGAGAGGLAVAAEAARRGKHVVVLEANGTPMSRQMSASRRYVGPFMYEWPWQFSRSQKYPPTDLTTWDDFKSCPTLSAVQPSTALEFAGEMLKWFDKESQLYPELHVAINLAGPLAERVKEYLRTGFRTDQTLDLNGMSWRGNGPQQLSMKPGYIVLAAGMGAENCTLPSHDGIQVENEKPPFKGAMFWEDDALQKHAENGGDIVVVGGGDGALQDVLRALTTHAHPVQTLEQLEKCKDTSEELERVREQLQTIDSQARLVAGWSWDPSEWRVADRLCREVAVALAGKVCVRKSVIECLREVGANSGQKVTLLIKEAYFDKAYLLNRFLVHLIHQVLKHSKNGGEADNRIGFDLRTDMDVQGVQKLCGDKYKVHCLDAEHVVSSFGADYVSVRFGIDRTTIPGLQMVHLKGEDQRQRTTLSRLPLPFVV